MKTRISIMIIMAMTACSALKADVFLKQKRHTGAYQMMGTTQPAEEVIESIWLTENRIATSSEKQSMLILMDRGLRVLIDHEEKTYTEIPLDMSKMAETDEEAQAMQQMMNTLMQMKVTVRPTGKTRQIGQWKCHQYMQSVETAMGTMNFELWASKEIPIDADLYSRFMSAGLSAMPGMQGAADEIAREFKKIEGVVVQSASNNEIMGQTIESTTVLLEYKTGKAKAGTFEIPKGYRKVNHR